MELQQEAERVLTRLIRFRTVNPPGDEQELQEWLYGYLAEAGFDVELHTGVPGRPNLVARLAGERPGPVLGYLSHIDTVLADPADWRHDPWSGEVADGFLWGRGALDMKDQTAAEVVGAAALARSGWRPPCGELRILALVDEEVGGIHGAKWLTETHPELARCDYLVNEGGGAVMPFGTRRLYGVCCAEKGTFRFKVRTRGVAGHASVPGIGENALLKLAPVLERLGSRRAALDMTEAPRALLAALGMDGADPDAAVERIRDVDPHLALMVDATLRVTAVPTRAFASEKINVVPALAELHVDCRVPPGMGREAAMVRIRELVGDDVEVEFLELAVGNGSSVASPLMDIIRDWIGEEDPGAEVVPTVLPAFTDSRWFRAAFPDTVAYGFFPQRHQTLNEGWPLMHGADERIDLRDLGFATRFFHELPRRLLA
jgi:acetylornithine deacetylase/succinyl-diaminopimelate desuccinylase-like protein